MGGPARQQVDWGTLYEIKNGVLLSSRSQMLQGIAAHMTSEEKPHPVAETVTAAATNKALMGLRTNPSSEERELDGVVERSK